MTFKLSIGLIADAAAYSASWEKRLICMKRCMKRLTKRWLLHCRSSRDYSLSGMSSFDACVQSSNESGKRLHSAEGALWLVVGDDVADDRSVSVPWWPAHIPTITSSKWQAKRNEKSCLNLWLSICVSNCYSIDQPWQLMMAQPTRTVFPASSWLWNRKQSWRSWWKYRKK